MSTPYEPEHAEEPGGPVPPDNQPGHHPPHEQDKPDLKAFAARLGTAPASEADTGPSPSATSSALASRWGLAALAAAVLLALGVAVLGIVVGRRRRLRTSR
ncbi:MAG: hypothetical protein M3066_04980 [Actinomycetota bacterium]|nr:hypothetical protein [Actinomycetota bacterium]